GRWRLPVSLCALGFVGTFVGLPLYSLVWRAGRVGGNAAVGLAPAWSIQGLQGTLRFAWDEASEPLGQGLVWAFASASVAVVLGWSLAWFSRKRGPWRWVTAVAVALALATPGPVTGFALVYAYRGFPRIYDSAAMVVLAGVARTFPYALLVLWPAVRSIPDEYLDAAEVDGLGPYRRVRQVAIPATLGAIVAAWAVTFTLSLGELPATNLVAPPGINPLSVVIWGLLHTGVESHLAGVVLIMLGAVCAAGLAALGFLAWLSGPGANPPRVQKPVP
ncbi:MAG: ABC transporter permease, partial [Isosphaeraceae bacterium]